MSRFIVGIFGAVYRNIVMSVLFLLLMAGSGHILAQPVTITWSLTSGPGNAVVNPLNANITTAAVSRGTNFNGSPVFNATFGYGNTGLSGGGNPKGWNESGILNAVTNLAFVEVSFTNNCQVSVAINSLSFITRTSAGNITAANSLIRYSTNNFITSNNVGSGQFTANSGSNTTANFNSLSINVPADSTIRFRLFAASIGGNERILYFRNFIINGTVTVAHTVNAGNAFEKTCVVNVNGAPVGEGNASGYTYAWSPAAGLSSSSISNPTANPVVTTVYTVVKTHTASTCLVSDTVTVVVDNTPPSATVAGPFTIDCLNNSNGAPVGGANQSGVTYAWSPAAGLSSTSNSNPTANPASTTTYTLIVTKTSSGCTNSGTVTVTVNNTPPVADAGNGFVITCISNSSGDTIGEPGVAGHTYAWVPSAGLDDSTLANPIANPTTTTTYTVTKTDTSNGCTDTDTVTITYNKVLPVLTGSSNSTLCAGDTVILSVSGADSYTWAPGTGLSATTGSQVSAFPASTQLYTVTGLLTSSSCTDTLLILVTVNQPSVAGSIIGPAVICNGDTATFNVQGSLGTNAAWHWYSDACNGVLVDTGLNIRVSPSANLVPVVKKYFVRAEGPAPCPLTTVCDSVPLTVNPVPAMVSSLFDTTCSGLPVQYSIKSTITNNVSYSWSSSAGAAISGNSQLIPGTPGDSVITDTLVNSSFSALGYATYKIVLAYTANGLGCPGDTQVVAVTVEPAPPGSDFSVLEGLVNQDTICGGSEHLGFYLNSAPGFTYNWTVTPPAVTVRLSGNSNPPYDSANVIITFPDSSNTYLASVSVTTTSQLVFGRCKSDTTTRQFTITPGGITERSIILKQPGNLLIYPDNTVDGYQWGYDSLPTLKSSFIEGQVYQIFVPVDTGKFLTTVAGVSQLDTSTYLFWVDAYKLKDGDYCVSRIYYNGPNARRPGLQPAPLPTEVAIGLMPNPNNGVFNLQVAGNTYGFMTAKIVNNIGQVASEKKLEKTAGSQQFLFDLSNHGPGVYFMFLYNAVGERHVLKLIIQ